jgi:predicted transcriptional regulator of viral defense system
LRRYQTDSRIRKWVEDLQAKGHNAFSLAQLQAQLPTLTEIAVKRGLNKLSRVKLIISVHKGFYLIIPPSFKSRGMVPPHLYLDSLMRELNRKYYLGLLSAAALHGASHQQPQEFFVVTGPPTLRATKKKGIRINYITKTTVPEKLCESRKTESGYIKISNPVLTAIDLIQFEKRIGGMNRVATVLNELTESIKPEDFGTDLLNYAPITALQRLGYILDKVFNNQLLAESLYKMLRGKKVSLLRIPLKPLAPRKGFMSDSKWKVIVNTTLQMDE